MSQVCSFNLEVRDFTKRINCLIILRGKRSGYALKLNRKDRLLLQEDNMKSLQEVEELKKMCCTEAERAKQLRRDELSIQEKENKSAVKFTNYKKR